MAGLFSIPAGWARAGEGQHIEAKMSLTAPDVVDGSTAPQDVPYFVKYGMFLRKYESGFRYEIAPDLSSMDDAILVNASANQENWEIQEQHRYDTEFLRICSNRQGKQAIILARETDRAANESNNRRAAQYRHTVNSLSENGRRAVDEFVETRVTPGILTTVSGNDEFAAADPEAFVEWIEVECQRILTGNYPADVQRAFDEFTHQIRVEGAESSIEASEESD